MGDILPFVAKVRSSGDWTPGERARLEELAERFADMADGVEVVFGATDEGDPWCVVKDFQDEILVHVARIGGKFVIHYALDDALSEGADLPTLLAERLAWEEDDEFERESVVVPFSRRAQSLLALIIATAFFYETAHLGRDEEAEPASGRDVFGDDAGAFLFGHSPDLFESSASHFGTKAAGLLGVGAAIAWPSRSFAASSVEDPAPVAGPAAGWSPGGPDHGFDTPLADPALLQPTHGAEEARPAALVMAEFEPSQATASWRSATDPQGPSISQNPTDTGPGVESLAGGGGGARQMLTEGGAGADRLDLSPRSVAAGGAGGDEFVARKQEDAGPGSLMGVIADFRPEEGDRLVNAFGMKVQVLGENATSTTLTAVPGVLLTSGKPSGGPMVVNGRQVDVDVDFDGKVDGFVVLVNYTGRSLITAKADELPQAIPHEAAESVNVLAGHTLDHYDL
ncbi:hypothetical protein [Phenylobacterium deserti]|uniref:Uncharacterized protein n=1 Tax=Phenylobacterium deserti TaxID=1914756 RepID=A0A328AVM8_9CAUL|nr:hypothetical protein [Phenylobacterium deserti]RAK56978.1 hypothetical protein DJ018_03155 [Phenylobacterium deserti]